MKKTWLFCLMAVSALLVTSCGHNSGKEDVGAEVLSEKISLTHEDAIRLSGYINCESNHVAGISADGEIRGYNNSYGISDSFYEKYGVARGELVKYIAAEYDDDFFVLDKNGNTGGVQNILNDEFSFKGVRDIFFTASSLADDYLTVIFQDGTVWSSANDLDPTSRIEDCNDVIFGSGSGSISGLIFTHVDGTVSIEPIRNIWNKDKQLPCEQLQSETASWSDITMAVMGGGSEPFAAGIKSDGTVTATGSYAQHTKDWENIVYIEAANGVIAGLTSDGKVKIAGDNTDATKYESISTGEVSDPVKWEDIIAISMNNDGAIIGLTADGEIIGFCGGSNGEKGIGPDKLVDGDLPQTE